MVIFWVLCSVVAISGSLAEECCKEVDLKTVRDSLSDLWKKIPRTAALHPLLLDLFGRVTELNSDPYSTQYPLIHVDSVKEVARIIKTLGISEMEGDWSGDEEELIKLAQDSSTSEFLHGDIIDQVFIAGMMTMVDKNAREAWASCSDCLMIRARARITGDK